MKAICLVLAALIALPLTAQSTLPLVIADNNGGPLLIQQVKLTDLSPQLSRVALRLLPATLSRLTEAKALVTYWKADAALGGHVEGLSEGAIYAGETTMRLNRFALSADRIVVSLIAVTSLSGVWERSASGQMSPLARSGSATTTSFKEADWKVNPPTSFSTTNGTQGCTGTLDACAKAASDVCGNGKVGGVNYNGSNCQCCFWCQNSPPPDCGGGGGSQ